MSWSTQPLPPGWECKYDPNQQKYFFIDHTTHSTSWEDPRKMRMEAPAAWSAYQRAQQPQPGMSFEMTARTQPEPPTVRDTSLEDKEKKRKEIAARLAASKPAKPKLSDEMEEKLDELKNLFPGTAEDTILDNLNKCGKDVEKAVDKLMTDGHYRCSPSKVDPKQMWKDLKRDCPTAKNSVLRRVMVDYNYDNEAIRDRLQTKGYLKVEQPAPSSGPSSSGLSPDKAKFLETLKKRFPGRADEIDMALNLAEGDEFKAITIMQEIFSPEALGADKGSSSTAGTAPSTSAGPSKSTPPAKTATAKPAAAQSNKPSSKAQQPKHQAKTQKTPAASAKKTAPPPSSQYTSALRTKPMGTDPSLRAGPDPERLIKTWTAVAGPNTSLVSGPCHSVGPTRGLAKGPSSSASVGRDYSLVKGTVAQSVASSGAATAIGVGATRL